MIGHRVSLDLLLRRFVEPFARWWAQNAVTRRSPAGARDVGSAPLASAQLIPALAALTAAAIGIVSLSARLFATGHGGLGTARPDSALCLLLLGLTLALLGPFPASGLRAWLSVVVGVAAGLIAAVSLAATQGGLRVPWPSAGALVAGACLLAATATVVVGLGAPRGSRLAQGLAMTVFAVGLLGLIGHAYGAGPVVQEGAPLAIALPTAVGLVALAVASLGTALASRVERGKGTSAQLAGEGWPIGRSDLGADTAWRLLVPVLALPVIVGWLHLAAERRGWLDRALGTTLTVELVIVTLSGIALLAGRRVSRAVAREREASRQRDELLVQLESERQRLSGVLERLPAGVLVADAASGRIAFANAHAQRLLGEPHDAEARAYTAGWRPRHANGRRFEADEMPLLRALRGETVWCELMHFTGPDGRHGALNVSAAPLRGRSGEVTGAVATFEDVTRQTAIQEALRRSESELHTIVENLVQGVVVADMEGRFLHWNHAALEMHGVEGDRPPRPLAELPAQFEFGDDAGSTIAFEHWPFSRILRGEQLRDVELRVRNLMTGRERVVSYSGNVVRDERGRAALAVLTAHDVTQRKQAQQALAAAKAEAEAANRAKDQFIAVLSHELRTPLTPVLGGIGILGAEQALSQRGRHAIEVLKRNVELEARLIDDLLDTTRIVRGKVSLERRRVDLATIIEQTIETCRPDIEDKQLMLEVDMGPRPYVLDGDAARLQQVFWNLLKNAAKFTDPGGRVSLRCRPVEGSLVAEVEDTGIGVAPADAGSIFGGFVQARHPSAAHAGGLGLGLAISKAFVEMHGGSIEAQSRGLGQGTCMRVRLPILGHGEAAPASEQQEAPAGTAEPRASSAFRVLLVDDDPDTLETLTAVLQLAGHVVSSARDVASALAAFAGGAFDVVVSDLGLPDRSGLELARELRRRGVTVPAIALSGYGQEADMERSRSAGFDLHLVKPVAPQRLLEAIEALGMKDGRRLPPPGPVPGA